MRTGAIGIALVFGLASGDVLAQAQQGQKGDAMEKLRACSALAQPERLKCLDKLSRDIGASSPAGPAPAAPAVVGRAADDWVVSETTSPVDYSPVAIATAVASNGPNNAPMQLSIQCRNGRTDLVISSKALAPRAEGYAITYDAKDGKPPAALPVGLPASGAGFAIRGDVVRLLMSLPDHGEVSFRVAGQGVIIEGRYGLAALKAVLARMARPCNWQSPAGTTGNPISAGKPG